MSETRVYVISIAGLDPCGGAGILADIKTFEGLGVMGFGVATALTYQNEDEFDGVKWLDWETIENQLTPLLRRYTIKAVKVGLIQSLGQMLKLCKFLKSIDTEIKIVWDPVLSATAGRVFHKDLDHDLLKQILPLLDLVTPNKNEAKFLVKALNKELKTDEYQLAESFSAQDSNFLLKSIDSTDGEVIDRLLMKTGQNLTFRNQKLSGKEKHGTGCVMSSAIAAEIAKGESLERACHTAKEYVHALMCSTEGKLGVHSNITINSALA